LIHAALLALLVVAVMPAAWWRGSTAGIDSAFWTGVGWTVLRGATLSAFVALIAASLTVIARYTAAAITVLFGYAIWSLAGETLLREFRHWGPIENGMAFANNGDAVRYVYDDLEMHWYEVVAHGPASAVVIVAVAVVVIGSLAAFFFQRRDIT